MVCSCEWHTPLENNFTRAWSGPGSPNSTSSTTNGFFGSTYIAARPLTLIDVSFPIEPNSAP
jgi:hypothetical protein